MSVTSIRLRPEVESGLEVMSGKLHRSKNRLINQAVRELVARHELEQSRWTETLTGMESVAHGSVRRCTSIGRGQPVGYTFNGRALTIHSRVSWLQDSMWLRGQFRPD